MKNKNSFKKKKKKNQITSSNWKALSRTKICFLTPF